MRKIVVVLIFLALLGCNGNKNDVAFGEKLGVGGTPSFLLGVLEDGQLKNIQIIRGAQDLGTFAKVINELKGK